MKKLLFVLLTALLLAACNTDEQTNAGQQKNILLYKSDSNAEYTMPFEATYDDKEDLVTFIYNNTNEHDVVLLDYTFEQDDKSLILNLGDDVYTIQGSAGANMFVETLAKSYFENYPQLEEITFIHKGSDDPILDHMNIGEPYKRQDFTM